MKNKAFTLIELLVVIVIIGILATLTTATYTNTQKKARDTQRQTFVQQGRRILISEQLGNTIQDYRLGGVDVSGVTANIIKSLSDDGYQLPIPENDIGYYVFLQTTDITAEEAQAFMLFSCKIEKLGATTGAVKDVAFISGVSDANSAITDENARNACGTTTTDPVVNFGWTCINLSTGAACS